MSISRKDLERDEVRKAVVGLLNTANRYSVTHLQDPLVRYYFKREYLFLEKCLIRDYENGILVGDKVVRLVKQERQSLKDQATALGLYGLGIIAGAGQVTMGYGICTADSIFSFTGMSFCGGVGAPMLLHGGNNLYENSYKIAGNIHQNWTGRYTGDFENVSGPLKKGYRLGAEKLGLKQRDADAAYAGVDLATSAYGLINKRSIGHHWANMADSKKLQLFRYFKADYEKGIKTMSKTAFGGEVIGNINTAVGAATPYLNEDQGKE
ncbi:DUF4225 domain-containing protein [Vibrio owensii]|uniref:DUF4225 domain-containing protein n=1 Tax=Vibrio owensii TaxID=696485 RepID=UPI003AAA3364